MEIEVKFQNQCRDAKLMRLYSEDSLALKMITYALLNLLITEPGIVNTLIHTLVTA